MPGIRGSRGRILVVEDEPLIGLAMEAALNDAGYRVIGLPGSGPDALHACAKEQAIRAAPDVVLMDVPR